MINDDPLIIKITVDGITDIPVYPELIKIYDIDPPLYACASNGVIPYIYDDDGKLLDYQYANENISSIRGPGRISIFCNGHQDQYLDSNYPNAWLHRFTVKVIKDNMYMESINASANYILLSKEIIRNVSNENYPIVKITVTFNNQEVSFDIRLP
jgi:hypothetical protein